MQCFQLSSKIIPTGIQIVTTRPVGYEDTTVTYICKKKILSHMYAKHQCREESEYESIVVIYIPTILYKYTVITDHDPILHEYYITRSYKRTIYKGIHKIQRWYVRTNRKKELRSRSREDWEENKQYKYHYAFAAPL